MANEVIEIHQERPGALALTRDAVTQLQQHRSLLMEYVQSQLRKDVDFGIVPGTDKPTLYKPGAEKMRTLFSLQAMTVMADKELDRPGNFAMFTYRTEIRDKYGNLLATCEGSCNSQEKKYRERNTYKWVNKKKEKVGTEATPVCDVLNTLQKMAQKRSFVGAIILATGASDFFNQDIDDPEDADALGIDQDKKPAPARMQVTIPKTTAASSQNMGQGAGDFVIPFGNQKGEKLSSLSQEDLASLKNWIDGIQDPKGTAKQTKDALYAFLGVK
jgi:hypothetical protein